MAALFFKKIKNSTECSNSFTKLGIFWITKIFPNITYLTAWTTLKRQTFAKIYFLKYKFWHTLCGCILPSDDTFLRGLIFRITNITHVDSGYGGKKDIKAELLKLNKSVNIVCHYFHANYKETETFHLNIKTTVINQFDQKIQVDLCRQNGYLRYPIVLKVLPFTLLTYYVSTFPYP